MDLFSEDLVHVGLVCGDVFSINLVCTSHFIDLVCRSRLHLWRVDLHKLDLSHTRSTYILTDRLLLIQKIQN